MKTDSIEQKEDSIEHKEDSIEHKEDSIEQKEENLRVMYTENGLISRHYLEWRHKIILRFFVTNGSLLIIAKYLFDSQETKYLIFIPFFISAAVSLIFYFANEGVSEVLKITMSVGSEIEKKISIIPGGFYTAGNKWLQATHFSNTFIWKFVYLFSCILFLFSSTYLGYYFWR